MAQEKRGLSLLKIHIGDHSLIFRWSPQAEYIWTSWVVMSFLLIRKDQERIRLETGRSGEAVGPGRVTKCVSLCVMLTSVVRSHWAIRWIKSGSFAFGYPVHAQWTMGKVAMVIGVQVLLTNTGSHLSQLSQFYCCWISDQLASEIKLTPYYP